MTMIPTPTGYNLIVKPPPRHRAVMTAGGAWLNLAVKVGVRPQRRPGDHYIATYTPAALAAEAVARLQETLRGGAR